ncbi:Flagellar biosynthesis protein, FliO [Syntrophomonas zehnderi OL-4]|uniref:Flagellar biosynthesis protein, FliO n=1 Tax=Syntrophomonas zehnderi OL-4 TaxID=690567 RepID=A0A0E4GAU8_9FIRM|nr:flagellar biosynthetic protein FliO [Syntrophomonas zehnderi]CFX65438.1 Flagellar biosynthesis protein, FliO [Syntrophomonas zehnderi OL-4]
MRLINKRRWFLLVFLAVFIVILVGSAAAVDVDNFKEFDQKMSQQQPQEIKSSNLWLSLLQLLLVLGIIVAVAWSIIRLFGRQVNAKMQGTWINVVDEVVLGQNRGILLCEVGGKLYALGVTDKEISLLFEVDNPKLLEEISQGSYEFATGETKTWPDWWTQLSSRFINKNRPLASKKFQNQMQTQSQKIREIASHSNYSRESATKRSGDDE